MVKLFLWLVAIYLFLTFAPHPTLDCRNYRDRTFHGVVVNCDKGGVR